MKETAAKRTPDVLTKKGTNTIKYTLVGKMMRNLLRSQEQQEDDAIIERFIAVLLKSNTTRADIAEAIKPTDNSTIVATIQYNEEGTIRLTSLTKPLRAAYKQAEDVKRQDFEKLLHEKFKAKQKHQPEDLLKFNEMCKKMEHPFNGKFYEGSAVAA